MEGIVEQVYLSVFVRWVLWKMKRNRNTMGRLIHAGTAYSSPRLSRLDLNNQRLGMQLHTTLLRLLVLRALANEQKKQGCSAALDRQRQLTALYGGSATGWMKDADAAHEH